MTIKERWLAALRLGPLDRLPFWPKLERAYLRAWGERGRWTSLAEIHGYIGSDRHDWLPSCLREIRSDSSVESESNGDLRRRAYHAPSGAVTDAQRFDPMSQSWHPIEFPIKTAADLAVMTDWFADARYEIDPDRLDASRQAHDRLGSGGVSAETIGESPLMSFVEWLAGVENAHLLIADHRAAVERLFEVVHQKLLDRTRLLCEHSPADMVYMSENTSTTLISPEQYRTYCAPHIGAYAGIAREHGRMLVLHMCGHLKALLPDLERLDVTGFEAFTSPPVGNTTLADGRSGCPTKCLIGGTNAVLWTRPANEIISEIERDLDELPHHRGIVVTSAGVMPPMCSPDTIKQVCEWTHGYEARL